MIFVDNSGADIILGILPFAREMLRQGMQVLPCLKIIASFFLHSYGHYCSLVWLSDYENLLVKYILSCSSFASSVLKVVLAANELPSINDVTYIELAEILSKVMNRVIRVLLSITD